MAKPTTRPDAFDPNANSTGPTVRRLSHLPDAAASRVVCMAWSMGLTTAADMGVMRTDAEHADWFEVIKTRAQFDPAHYGTSDYTNLIRGIDSHRLALAA